MPAHFGISGTSLGVPQGGGTPPGGGDPGMTYTAPSQPIVLLHHNLLLEMEEQI